MSATAKWTAKGIATAAVALVLLVLAGGVGWQRLQPSSTKRVEMEAPARKPLPHLAALPAPASPRTGSEAPNTSPSAGIVSDDRGPEPPSAPEPVVGSGPPSPSFDVVRVEPSGDALLAGRSKPGSTVALVDRGRVVAETKADAGGNFVITPPTLKPGNYALSLREGQGRGAQDSKQSVVVSVPSSKAQQVVVAMAEPGKATTLLSMPTAEATRATGKPPARDEPSRSAAPAPAPAAGAAPKLVIRSVELENGSGLFASGLAPPGTDVRLYLNNSRVADVVAAAVGAWSVTVRKGLSAGHYAVRVDAVKPDQSVAARVEVPFDVPVAMSDRRSAEKASVPQAASVVSASPVRSFRERTRVADAAPVAPSPTADTANLHRDPGPSSSSADAVVDELETELVTRGDNLWRISRKRLGYGKRYTQIYAANTAQIRDPRLIYPGQVFVMPRN